MKKFFTLIAMCILALSAQAGIKIYVQSAEAPFLWTWGAVGGTFNNVGEWPGTLQMTEKYTHPDTGDEFWMYEFPDEITQISFLFNNGQASGTKKTGDIADVTSDRYFTLAWDDGQGNVSCVDVTEDYTEIPDATVTSVGISGTPAAWGWGDPAVFADVVEAGKTFKLSFDPATLGENVTSIAFKFRPNGASWMGYWDIYYDAAGEAEEGKTSNAEAPEWLDKTDDGNFLISLKKYTASAFTFTLTWNGGKSAASNWTIKAEATDLQKLESGETTWTVAGVADLCGGEGWNPANTANDMTKADDGTYTLTLSGLTLAAGSYAFKVCADHAWNESYGEGGSDKTLTIDADGTYDVVITFNPETKEVSAVATIATGISSVKSSTAGSAAMFNLQGQRVQQGFRGIAIVGGRKVMVK